MTAVDDLAKTVQVDMDRVVLGADAEAQTAVCASCGTRADRPVRDGDPPEWKRGPDGWITGAGPEEFCSAACRDSFAKPLPAPPGSTPCSRRRELQPCERSAPRSSATTGAILLSAMLGMCAASGVSIEPPPPRRR